MTSAFIRPEATATITADGGAVELPISDGKVTWADDWTPHVQATFDVPLEDQELLEQIDPRENQRVTVTATEAVTGSSFTADLGLRSRTVNHKDGKITLELASDEALLMDRCNVTTSVDSTPRTYESSLRSICNWALGKIGATLEAGTEDADLTATWDARNMILDPRYTGNAAGLWSAVNCSYLVDTTYPGWHGVGNNGVHLYSGTAEDSYLSLGGDVGAMRLGMQGGKTYVFSATGRVSQAFDSDALGRSRRLVVHAWSGSRGGYLIWNSPAVPNTAGTSSRVSVEFTVPEDATSVFVRAYLGDTGSGAGRITWGHFQLVERGPGTVADDAVYFQGYGPNTSAYTFAWDGTPDATASRRTAIVERLPELFTWNPGQSLWDFLEPLLEASGLRLFCDEDRKWRLVDPETYEADGFVAVQAGHNAIDGDDSISRNDDTWADAVVCKFTWADQNGITQTKYDVAGDPTGKCTTYEFDEPFIPGRAARRLAVLQGRGRTQEVTVLGKYTARPGQDVTINLPGTVIQTGKLREVIVDLRTGLMDLGTRGLTDVYPGAWTTWDPEETWSEVDPALNWSDL